MNTGKTKVMFSRSMTDKVEEQGKWPCHVCKKRVSNNLSFCTCCQKWVQNDVVKGGLRKVSTSFVCKNCSASGSIPATEMSWILATEYC